MTLYRAIYPLVYGLSRLLFRVQVLGREHVPASGVYVVAPSHRSILDIPFTAFITKRRIRFMAKRELFEWTPLARALLALGGIPVDRGSVTARSALKACQAALEAGEPTAVFPEGTRRNGPEIADLFDGATYLAVKLGVPIVPVGIGGSEEILASGKVLPRLRRVVVVVGPPITPPAGLSTRRRSEVAPITEQLRVELQRLFDEAMARAGY